MLHSLLHITTSRAEGNFEGHNILNRLKGLPRSKDDEAKLAMLRSMLHQARSNRIRPGLDDKVLADWNGLMIAALAHAGVVFDQPAWIDMAARAFRFVTESMTRGDRLGHSWRDGPLAVPRLGLGLRLHDPGGACRCMKRPAIHPISTARSPGSAPSTATTPTPTPAATSSPPTMPRAW